MIEEDKHLLADDGQDTLLYTSDISMCMKWSRMLFSETSTAYNILNGLEGNYPDIEHSIYSITKPFGYGNVLLRVDNLFSICNKEVNLHVYLAKYNDNLLLLIKEKYENKYKYIVHSIQFPDNKMLGYIASEYSVYSSLPYYIKITELSSNQSFMWIGKK